MDDGAGACAAGSAPDAVMRWAERLVASDPGPRPWSGPLRLLVACSALAVSGCFVPLRFACRNRHDDPSPEVPLVVAVLAAVAGAAWIARAVVAGRERGRVERVALAALAGVPAFAGLFASFFLVACAALGWTAARPGFSGSIDFLLSAMLATAALVPVQIVLALRPPGARLRVAHLAALVAWASGLVNFYQLGISFMLD